MSTSSRERPLWAQTDTSHARLFTWPYFPVYNGHHISIQIRFLCGNLQKSANVGNKTAEKAVSEQDLCLECNTALPICNFYGKIKQNFVHMLFLFWGLWIFTITITLSQRRSCISHWGSGFVFGEGAVETTTVDTVDFGGLAAVRCSCWAGTVWIRTLGKETYSVSMRVWFGLQDQF